MGILNCGIVSQNISLYCAAAGLSTVPRASMQKEEIAKELGFNNTRKVWINHPIGFAK
jgi:nitroreductase